MVRQTSELETNVVAVERTKEYSETENEVSGEGRDERWVVAYEGGVLGKLGLGG